MATLVVAIFVSLSIAPLAHAASKPIKVVAPKGYTVIALGTNGKAASVKGKGVKVSLNARATEVTLHLVASDGVYAGPVVFGQSARNRVVMGVRAGTDVGRLKVNAATGMAAPARKLKKSDLANSITAKAQGGVPIGANNKYGLVKSQSSGTSKQGNDVDHDGVPGAFDIDVNGNLILNNQDRSASSGIASVSGRKAWARIAADSPPPPGSGQPPPPGQAPPGGGQSPGAGGDTFRVFSNLKLEMKGSLNVNASNISDAQIDQMVKTYQTLAIQVASGGEVELNCTGLSYCSPGGTGGTLSQGDFNSPPAFPDCCDSDGDGFGTIRPGSTGDFQLHTGATSGQIGSGDTFVEIVGNGGTATDIPGALNFAFVTTPALASWSLGPSSGTVSYPVAEGAPGTMNNPFPVAASGDVVVRLTYWRPQRKAIPEAGEGNGLVDMGKLFYSADVPNGPTSQGGPGAAPGGPSKGPGHCPVSSYSTSDPNLKIGNEGLEDQTADQPSNPANTLTFSVNLTACLASISWSSGQELAIDIDAYTKDGDNSAQKIHFKRQ